MKRFAVLLTLFAAGIVSGQDLRVESEDVLIDQGKDGGYHMWIRRTPDVDCVLLTESTADPTRAEAVYALRNPTHHPLNGDEKRMLDGEFLDPKKNLYSLIDSTPEQHPLLGEAFHIYIPYIVVYGYPWSRAGELQVVDGTFLNIRAFAKPYGDYSGGFRDNPFTLRVTQKPLEGLPEDNYMEDTLAGFRRIAEEGGGEAVLSTGEADVLDKLEQLIRKSSGDTLDLVLALDTTESMKNDIPHLRDSLVPRLKKLTEGFTSFRFGMVLYKDYFEQYVARTFPFQDDLEIAQRTLDSVRVFGGADIPEAVYEALYAGIHGFPWNSDTKMIVLVGDAPAHPRPRGSVTAEMVYEDAQTFEIELHTIILPQ